MPNVAKIGFTIFVRRGTHKLTLRRALPDRGAAVAAAVAMGAGRPIGLAGMMIRCEATREEWIAAALADPAEEAIEMRPPP